MSASKARAQHAIDIVEKGYMLDGTEEEWLARVLDAASADVDHGKGTHGMTCRVEAGTFAGVPTYLERNLDPGFRAVRRALNEEAPSNLGAILARYATVSGGVHEILGPDHPNTRHFRTVGATVGTTDGFLTFAQDGEAHGLMIAGPSALPVKTSSRVRGIWRRVLLHVTAGLRLRRRLMEKRGIIDALLDPGGALKHAEAPVSEDRSARDALIAAVRRVDRARTAAERRDPERALEMWRGLVAGEWSLIDRWESDGRRYVAAYRNRPSIRDPRALTDQERAVLHYVALGASNKEIAFALGIGIASVASAVSQLLKKFRGKRRSDLLVFAAPERAEHVRVSAEGRDIGILGVPFVTPARAARLTVAEYDVVEHVLRGASNAAIAKARRTSTHTVANQLRAIFAKLHVESRTELARAFFEDSAVPFAHRS
jgi:DNA-binding NarL/FixJ family response regulator